MTSFAGQHAKLYDLFYADKDYPAEAAFIDACLKRHGAGACRRILDLACGTGSHALLLDKLGYQILAVDISESMLTRAREKALEAGSGVEFALQDMCALDLPQAGFDAALCLFDSIGFTRTNQALDRFLRGIHRHLRPGGLLLFDFWHASAMIKHCDPVRIRRWSTPQGEVVRTSETSLDIVHQTGQVKLSVCQFGKDGTFDKWEETLVNRFFLVQEMQAFLSWHGFEALEWHPGFEDGPIHDQTWHVLALARRLDDTAQADGR